MQIPSSLPPASRPPSGTAPVRPTASVSPALRPVAARTPPPPHAEKNGSGLGSKILKSTFFGLGMGASGAAIGFLMFGPIGALIGGLLGLLGGIFTGSMSTQNKPAAPASGPPPQNGGLGTAQQDFPFVEENPVMPSPAEAQNPVPPLVQTPEERTI
ncbi:MAG: hypothetical protein ACO1RX_01890 [Candidatus Sericytochromatia bacterium]